MKSVKEKDTSLQEKVLWTIFAIIIGYTIFCIFTHLNPYKLGSDLVNEVTYRQLSWEQKTLFPDSFVMSNETYLNRPALIYWLFYGITKNFLLAYQMELVVVLILEIVAMFYLLKEIGVSPLARIVALSLFVMWASWEIIDMIYFWLDAYSGFIITTLVTLTLRMRVRKAIKSTNDYTRSFFILTAILILLAAFIGYSTIKMLVELYIPLFIMDIMKLFRDFIKKQRSNYTDYVMLVISILSITINFAFYQVVLYFHSDAFVPLHLSLAPVSECLSWEVISKQIESLIRICGISLPYRVKPFSVQFVRIMIRFVFVFLSVVVSIKIIKRNEASVIQFASISIFVMFMVEVLIASKNATPRYYYIITVAIPIACAIGIDEWEISSKKYLPFAIVVLNVSALFGCIVYMEELACTTRREIVDVADYIYENGYQYVTASYWNAGVIKGYTNGAVEALHCNDNLGIVTMSPHHWNIDTKRFYEGHHGEPNIVLLTDEQEEAAFEAQNSVTILLKNYATKTTEIGEYNLYALTENPFILARTIETQNAGGLPLSWEDSAVDLPTDTGYHYRNAELNEHNELVSNGTESIVLWGPYSDSVAGVYDITLHYVVDAYGEDPTGVFDVALDANSLVSVEFSPEEQTALLDDVIIDEGHRFEARVYVPEGMIVRIQSISYERVA